MQETPKLKQFKPLAPLQGGPAALLPLWNSTGVAEKPLGCNLCPFKTSGAGFVADWYPDTEKQPRLGFLLDFPSNNDVIERRPWSGAAGYAWEKQYLKPFGLSLQDVMISHVLRCRPKATRFGKPLYPTGKLRRDAEINCQTIWDDKAWGGETTRPGGIKSFLPNLFVVTFDLQQTLAVPALSKLVLRDIEKAVKKMHDGHRPLVLMGDEPKDLVAPWLRGAAKFWRGHWWHGEWPFGDDTSDLMQHGFFEA